VLDLTRSYIFSRGLKFLEQRLIGLQFIAGHMHDNDAQLERPEIVFVFQLPVNRDEEIELPLGKPEKSAVFAATPTGLRHSSDDVAGKGRTDPSIDALV
jgi:hypothetical protein